MAVSSPTFISRTPVTVRSGWSTTSTVKLAIFTLQDPTTSVTLTINGVTYIGVTGSPSGNQFQLIARGTPTVLWSGVLTVTGLEAGSSYTWSVSQGNNSDSGTSRTRPDGDQYNLWHLSCDKTRNHYSANPGTDNDAYIELAAGAWEVVRLNTLSSTVPVLGYIHNDDLGYIDEMLVDDSNISGIKHSGYDGGESAAYTSLVNDYLISWACYLGMLGPSSGSLENFQLSTLLVPRESNRAWCARNLNIFPMWGDHEFRDGISFRPVTQFPGYQQVVVNGLNGPKAGIVLLDLHCPVGPKILPRLGILLQIIGLLTLPVLVSPPEAITTLRTPARIGFALSPPAVPVKAAPSATA